MENNNLIKNRLGELYKKYFQGTDYKMGQDFESVKNNMTQEDYELSNKLLSYYGQQDTLSNQYNDSKNMVELERTKSLQENSIAREKAMKYLPEYLKMQGLGGAGLSESSIISEHNKFQNNRNMINSDANLRKSELLQNYNLGMNKLDSSYLGEEETIKDKYRNSLTEDESVVIETKFQNLIGSDGKISQEDYNTLQSYISGLSETIGANNVQKLQTQLKGYSPYVRTGTQQKLYDDGVTLENYRTGVGLSDGVKIHDNYGGGYSLSGDMKIKIKDGDEGISLQEFIDRSGRSGSDGLNHGEAGWFGTEKKDSKAIAKLAQNGELENGTIIDTNAGDGQNMWVYLNGRFYKIEKTQ